MAPSRLIRKQSIWSRLTSWPFDMWLAVNESIGLIEWNSYCYSVAMPLGGVLDLVFLFCRIYRDISSKTAVGYSIHSSSPSSTEFTSGLFDRTRLVSVGQTPVGTGSSWGSRWLAFYSAVMYIVTMTIVAICLINSVWLFLDSKCYTLLGRAADNPPETPSAMKLVYVGPSNQDDEDETNAGILSRLPFHKLIKRLWQRSEKSKLEDEGNEVWCLNIWDPPHFGLYLHVTFSPLHAFVIWFAPMGGFQLTLLALLSVVLFGLTAKFLTLAKDKEILHSEVLGEYNKKMVRPFIAVPRRDVSVGTINNNDDFRRPLVEVYSPVVTGKFQPRDVRETSTSVTMEPFVNVSPWTGPQRRNWYDNENIGYYTPGSSFSSAVPRHVYHDSYTQQYSPLGRHHN